LHGFGAPAAPVRAEIAELAPAERVKRDFGGVQPVLSAAEKGEGRDELWKRILAALPRV
jgi:hypothetical protein